MVKIRERDFIVTSPLLKKERKIAYISDVHGDYKTLKIVDYIINAKEKEHDKNMSIIIKKLI